MTSITGNITNIDSDSANITYITSLTTDAEIVKTNGINSSGTPNLTTVVYSALSGAFDNTFIRFNEYRCRLNTTLPMLFDAVSGLGGVPIKLNTSLPFLAPETFVFHGDQISLESGNNLKINTTGTTEISTLKVNSINNNGNDVNFTDDINVPSNKRIDAGTIGTNLIQNYNDAGGIVYVDATMSFVDSAVLYSKTCFVDLIKKHPASTGSRITIQADTINDEVIITTQKFGETKRSFYFSGSNFGTGDSDGSNARDLVLNGTAGVKIENLKTLDLRPILANVGIRLYTSISATADDIGFYARTFGNSSLTQDLRIATNVPAGTAINLQTRASGFSINNIRVLGNTLFSTRNSGIATNIVANPSISNSSDIRLKENIEPLTNGLDLINQLNIKKYQKKAVLNKTVLKGCEKDDGFDCECCMNHRWLEYGVIAQQVLKTDLSFAVDIPPDLENNPYTLNYNMLYNANLLATQELDKKIITLEQKIKHLEDIINSLLINK